MLLGQCRIQFLNLLFIAAGVALAFSPAANALRLGFPIMAAAYAGLLLHLRKSDHYASLCLWLFLMTPLIRRIVDFRTGFDPIAILLLAPYAALAFSVLYVPRIFNRHRVMDAPSVGFLLIFLAATTGLLIALSGGRYLAGGYDYVRWVLPLAFCVYVWTNRSHLEDIHRSIVWTFLLALPIMGLYGLYQFTELPGWDSAWIVNAEMDFPENVAPYRIRAFSTINSFGSLGHAMVVAILLLLVAPTPFKWVAIPFGLLALALTMSRTAWVGLSVGLIVLAVSGPLRTKLSVAALVAIVVFVFPAVFVFPELDLMLQARLESLTNLDGDQSMQERMDSYEGWMAAMLDQPLGIGLGAAGVYLRALSRGEATNIIDGGPIEVIQALGLGFGPVYLIGIGLVAWAVMVRRGVDTHANLMAGGRAVIIAQIVSFWSTTTTTGEVGFFLFTAVGLALAIPHSGRSRAPASDQVSHQLHQAREQVT